MSLLYPEFAIKCYEGKYPFGLSAIVVFYIFWTVYVCHVLCKDKFLNIESDEYEKVEDNEN